MILDSIVGRWWCFSSYYLSQRDAVGQRQSPFPYIFSFTNIPFWLNSLCPWVLMSRACLFFSPFPSGTCRNVSIFNGERHHWNKCHVYPVTLVSGKKEEFPRRTGMSLGESAWSVPIVFIFSYSLGGFVTPVRIGDWHSYLLFLATFERSQKWWFPLVISHVDHIKAMARHDSGPQPTASVQESGWRTCHRLYIKGNSFSWVKVHIFPLGLGNHPVLSSRA